MEDIVGRVERAELQRTLDELSKKYEELQNEHASLLDSQPYTSAPQFEVRRVKSIMHVDFTFNRVKLISNSLQDRIKYLRIAIFLNQQNQQHHLQTGLRMKRQSGRERKQSKVVGQQH